MPKTPDAIGGRRLVADIDLDIENEFTDEHLAILAELLVDLAEQEETN
jgi:hypothetical protein